VYTQTGSLSKLGTTESEMSKQPHHTNSEPNLNPSPISNPIPNPIL